MINSAEDYMEEYHEEYWYGDDSNSDSNLTLQDLCAIQRTTFRDGWDAALEILEEATQIHDTMGDIKGKIQQLKTD